MEDDFSLVGVNTSVLFLQDQVHILDNIFVRAGLILVYSLICLVSFLGNLALILVVTLEWKGRLLSKFYLGNLAAANFSVTIFSMPQNLSVYRLDRWIFGDFMCKMLHFMTSLYQTVSVLSLLVVSVERYLVLVHAFKSRQVLTMRRMKVVLLLVWLISAGLSLPAFLHSGLVRTPADDKGTVGEICTPTTSMSNSAVTGAIYFTALYAVPLAVMFAIYIRIGVQIRKCEKMRNNLLSKKFPSRFVANNDDDSRLRSNCGCASANLRTTLLVSSSRVSKYGGEMVPVNLGRCCSSFQGKTMRPQRPGIQELSGHRLWRGRCRKRQSLVRMLISIVVTFALLNLPFQVGKLCVNFLPHFDRSSDLISVISCLTVVLMYVNCAVNPVLFVFMSSRFRQSLRDLTRRLSGACSGNSDCV